MDNQEKRPLTRRRRAMYRKLKEMGFYDRIAAKGGKTTVEKQGRDHMKTIAAKGGKKSKRGPARKGDNHEEN